MTSNRADHPPSPSRHASVANPGRVLWPLALEDLISAQARRAHDPSEGGLSLQEPGRA